MTTPTEPPDMADAEPGKPAPVTPEATDGATPDATSDAAPGAATDTATGDGAAPAEDRGRVGATVPAWWTWVGRHRKPVMLVAGLAVVALVGTLVAVSVSDTGPEEVVESYLDAIHAGDTQTALEIAGEPEDDDGRLRFLSADALADDWAVDAIVARHVRETEADVDVTISAGDTRQQGRFHLVHGDDGWRIESPFVQVDLMVGDLDVIELGDVRQPARKQEGRDVAEPLLLFPGVYELYPSFADRIVFDPPLLIATPAPVNETSARLTKGYTLTGAGEDAAQEAIEAAVDECAATSHVSPPGCPFDLSATPALWRFRDVSGIAWTVVTHPEAHFVAKPESGVGLVVRKPGTVRVTGSGVPEGVEGAGRTTFTLTCEFGLANLTIAVTPDGVAVERVTGDEHAATLTTTCF